MCFLSVLNASVLHTDLNRPHQRALPRSPPPAFDKTAQPDHAAAAADHLQQNQVADSILQQILKLDQHSSSQQLHDLSPSSSSSSSSSCLVEASLHVEKSRAVQEDVDTLNLDQLLLHDLNHPTLSPTTTTTTLLHHSTSSQASAPKHYDNARCDPWLSAATAGAAAAAADVVDTPPSASAPTSPQLLHHLNGDALICSSATAAALTPPAPTTPHEDSSSSPTSTSPACSSFNANICEYVAPYPPPPSSPPPTQQRRSKSAEHATTTPPLLHEEVCVTPPPRACNSSEATSPCSWSSSSSFRCAPRSVNRRSASTSSPSSSSSSSIPLVVLRALSSSRSRREDAKPHTPIRIRCTTSPTPSSVSPSVTTSSFAAAGFQDFASLPPSPSMSDGAAYIECETENEDDDAMCESGQLDGDCDELKAMFQAQQRMLDELKRQKQERRRIDSWKRDLRRNWNFDIVC